MPNQTDIQKLIQGLAPGSVNNGNPNTIYNTPATVMGGKAAVPPPSTDGLGNWALNTLPQAATLPAPLIQLPQLTPSSQLGSWMAPRDPASLNLPQWSMMPFPGQGTPTPGTGTPPPITPPTDTGGNLPPIGPTHGVDPFGDFGSFDENGRWTPGNDALNMFGNNALFAQSFSINDPAFKKIWGIDSVPQEVRKEITDDSGQIDEAKAEGFFSKLFDSGSLLQALDVITEIFPFLGGVDWYNSDTGQFNVVSSAMQVVANALGLGPIFYLFTKFFNKKRVEEATQASNPFSAGSGCVLVDAHIHGFGRAGDVKVGDTLKVIDPTTFELSDATVSYSEAKLQPCVRITTKSGTVLECSISAPICDETGEEVMAENLLGIVVPVSNHGMIEFETVMKVEDIGEQLVQHITCENNYFLAGKKRDRYLLHHNAKNVEGLGGKHWLDTIGGHGSSPMGFAWGGSWGGPTGTVTVGPLQNVD